MILSPRARITANEYGGTFPGGTIVRANQQVGPDFLISWPHLQCKRRHVVPLVERHCRSLPLSKTNVQAETGLPGIAPLKRQPSARISRSIRHPVTAAIDRPVVEMPTVTALTMGVIAVAVIAVMSVMVSLRMSMVTVVTMMTMSTIAWSIGIG